MSARIDLQNPVSIKNWQHLATIEDEMCRFLQMNLGPIAYDMYTAMGIPEGACPIPKVTKSIRLDP